jgi:glycosyltransferase involved in cell wall biosynthesis
MRISIALATYNGEIYLSQQLDSFVVQTRMPDELVITDDCSTDNSLKICKKFAETAPFDVFIYENESNLGYCGNFNRALSKTTGSLVFLSDQDDVWFPEKIERLVSLAESDSESMVFMNDAALTNGELVDSGLTKLGQIRAAGFGDSSFVMGCCAAVRRDFLDLCMPIPNGYPAHDKWVVGIAIGVGKRRIHEEVLQYYRRHGDNTSQWVVNNPKPVSKYELRRERWLAYIISLRGIRKHSHACVADSKDPSKHLADWARNALHQCPSEFVPGLQSYLSELDKMSALQSLRVALRKLPFHSRVIEVLRLWWAGGYRDVRGWKSAVKDLFFR